MAFSSEAARGLNEEREVGEERLMSFLVADRGSPYSIKIISVFQTPPDVSVKIETYQA